MDLNYFKEQCNIKKRSSLLVICSILSNRLNVLNVLLNKFTFKEKEIMKFLIIALKKNKLAFIQILLNKKLINKKTRKSIINNFKLRKEKHKKINKQFINYIIKSLNEIEILQIKNKINRF